MNLIKKYRIILFITIPLFMLLAARILTQGSFKYDARKWAEPSFGGANLVSPEEIVSLPGQKLVVNLGTSNSGLAGESVNEVTISPDSVLSRKYLDKIKNHKGAVILSSADLSLSARIWMVISQTGCSNLYILTGSNDNEAFKGEFRPDTMIKPEL